MKKTWFYQCKLRKDLPEYPNHPRYMTWTMSWVEERHAIEGKYLTLQGDPEPWRVFEVYRSFRMDREEMTRKGHAHNKWRGVTDV